MTNRPLPPFRPVFKDELRRIWTAYPTDDVRRLTLEVERYRRLLAEIDTLFATAHQAWRNEVGGDMVALHLLKQILDAERLRRP
ncbi:hypothetical protein SSTU70S_05606 [Stutzerimonas stutzeri]